MGRTNTAGLVKYWLQHEGRNSLQIRKFYSAEDLLLIFQAFPTVNDRPNPYTSVNITKGYVRSFATILNQIARNKWLPTFKHRHTKDAGFQNKRKESNIHYTSSYILNSIINHISTT